MTIFTGSLEDSEFALPSQRATTEARSDSLVQTLSIASPACDAARSRRRPKRLPASMSRPSASSSWESWTYRLRPTGNLGVEQILKRVRKDVRDTIAPIGEP